ncbi:MAG: hypothetical protein V4676_12715 [Bacteroidota bacterium]
MRYASWGTQIFVLLGLAVWGGLKLDKLFNTPLPLLVWILPFVILIAMIWKVIKDTSKKKSGDDKNKI